MPKNPKRAPAGPSKFGWRSSQPYVVVAIVLLVATGIVESGRLVADSKASKSLVSRFAEITLDFDEWSGTETEAVEESLAIAEIVAYRQIVVREQKSGCEGTIFVACGPHDAMVVHRPEVCLPSTGLRQMQETKTLEVACGSEAAKFSYADFGSDAPGATKVRIYYGFNAGHGWQAEHRPHREFGDLPYLVKLYVICPSTRRSTKHHQEVESLMQACVSELNRTLFLSEDS